MHICVTCYAFAFGFFPSSCELSPNLRGDASAALGPTRVGRPPLCARHTNARRRAGRSCRADNPSWARETQVPRFVEMHILRNQRKESALRGRSAGSDVYAPAKLVGLVVA